MGGQGRVAINSLRLARRVPSQFSPQARPIWRTANAGALPCHNRPKSSRSRSVVPRARISRDAQEKGELEGVPPKARVRETAEWTKTWEYREKNSLAGADGQPGQGVSAARRGLRRRGLREDDEVRAWFARLRRLLPLASFAPLQGAGVGGLVVDDGRRGGVRWPQQHDRRPRQYHCALFAKDDRGFDHMHGRGHRRRFASFIETPAAKGFGCG